jgi:hypothetical protein
MVKGARPRHGEQVTTMSMRELMFARQLKHTSHVEVAPTKGNMRFQCVACGTVRTYGGVDAKVDVREDHADSVQEDVSGAYPQR